MNSRSKTGSNASPENTGSQSRTSRKTSRKVRPTLSASEIGDQLLAQLPERLRGDIDSLIEESDHTFRGARDYIRDNPREALGVAIGVGALAWTVFGTSPGRKVVQWGAMMALPHVTGWIADRFDRGEVGDMQAQEENVSGTHEASENRSKRQGRVIKTAQSDEAELEKQTH